MSQRVFELSAARFDDFEGFVRGFNRVLVAPVGGEWHGSLDAFNDYLSWPECPYVLCWKQAWKSRRDLGYEAMLVWCLHQVLACDPPSQSPFWEGVDAARIQQGPTLFDTLIEIICDNAPHVTLELEEGL